MNTLVLFSLVSLLGQFTYREVHILHFMFTQDSPNQINSDFVPIFFCRSFVGIYFTHVDIDCLYYLLCATKYYFDAPASTIAANHFKMDNVMSAFRCNFCSF